MKQVIICNSFRKRLKGLRRHFNENDVVNDVKRFTATGFGKGECELKQEIIGETVVSILNLRIRVQSSIGRYLLAVVNNEHFIPVFIDLKTGRYGKNMSFTASREVVSMLERAFEETLLDYLEHTEENPKFTKLALV